MLDWSSLYKLVAQMQPPLVAMLAAVAGSPLAGSPPHLVPLHQMEEAGMRDGSPLGRVGARSD